MRIEENFINIVFCFIVMQNVFLKKENEDYFLNFYRYKRYKKNIFLLTLDDGNFVFLSKNGFRQLRRGKIENEKLFLLLKERGTIITSENFDSVVQKTSKRYSFLANSTSLHILILTKGCNLSCNYCFASACDIDEKFNMDINTAKKVVEFVMKSPGKAKTIEFQGGEPLANYEVLKKVVVYAKELNKEYKKDLRFALVTNLTLMTEERVNWLIDNNVTICTSLDGPAYVHDKNRFILGLQNKKIGTHEKVVYWIERINKIYTEKKIRKKVNALMTITSYSLPYHKEIIDEYLKYNINYINIRALTFVGRATETGGISYTKEKFVDFFEKSLEYLKELHKKGIKITERIVELYIQKIIENTPGYHTEYESPCGALTGQITYYIDGNIYTCNEAMGREEFLVGSVFEDEWSEIFRRKESAKAILNSMLEQNVICDRCAYKPYCSTCMVENFSRDKKFNFYPTKTQKHFETISHCNRIFDKIIER